MNNKFSVVSVVALIVSVFAVILGGYAAHHAGSSDSLGGTINYTNSGGSSNLYTSLESALGDIYSVRRPLSAISIYSSSSFAIPSVITGAGTSTLTSSTAGSYTQGAFGEPSIGDLCLASTNATGTPLKAVAVTCQVTATGTILFTFTAPTSSAYGGGAGAGSLVSARVFPSTYFIQPAALQTVTSTSN